MTDFEAAEFDDELLSAYLDDELTPEERARVEERVAADPRARQLLEGLRTVSGAVKELPPATLGIDLRETILRRAERAMLVSGGRNLVGGLNEVARRIPIGRSKRAWFWAAAAVAAGLMLMVFERERGANKDLPGEVAVATHARDKDASHGPLPPLEVRALEAPVNSPKEETDRLAAAQSAAPQPQTAASPATDAAPLGDVMLDRAGGGMGGAMTTMGARSSGTLATDVRGRVDVPAEDLLVVHVNVTPEALKTRKIDAVLFNNKIEVEKPTADEAKSAETSDVDMIIVNAAPAQLYGCFSDLKKDKQNVLGIAVDEESAANQRSKAAQDSVENFKQYNRGASWPQQKVALDRNNNFSYEANSSAANVNRQLADSNEAAQQPLSAGAPVAAQNRAVRIEPQSRVEQHTVELGYGAQQESLGKLGVEAEGKVQQQTAAQQDRFYGGVQQNFARRAAQKLAAKAESLQVLFVLQASEPPQAAKLGEPPATSPPVDDPVR